MSGNLTFASSSSSVHASTIPAALAPVVSGNAQAQTSLDVNEINPVILVRAADGRSWIKVEVHIPKHKERLAKAWIERQKDGAVVNLTHAYEEENGARNYLSTDSESIKELRAVAAEVLGNSFTEEYLKGARTSTSTPTMQCPTKIQQIDGKDTRFATSCKEILEKIEPTIPKDQEERRASLKRMLEKFTKQTNWQDMAHCASNLKGPWKERCKTVADQLKIDSDKYFQTIADTVRLTCKTRAEYMTATAELKTEYPEKSFVDSRDGLATFATQMLTQDSKSVLDSSLFDQAFRELHEEDRKTLRQELIKLAASSSSAVAAPSA
jgi:hypothetical protein